jgi:hypothetical protein
MRTNSVVWMAVGCMAALIAEVALAANVKVTPLGGQDGEFCPQDRALIFEDPSGTRILYDAGRTVAGPNDPRLGKIDIILVSHMHGDHAGNAHNKEPNSGSCASPDVSVSALPNSSTVNIALAKKAKIVTGSEMPPFFAGKLKANGGDPRDSILTRFGGSVKVGGVTIATKIRAVEPASTLRFPQFDQWIPAAIEGAGIAIGVLPHLTQQLRDGVLCAPFGRDSIANRGTFFVVLRRGLAERDGVNEFVAWLRSEVRRDGELALGPTRAANLSSGRRTQASGGRTRARRP